MTTGCLSGIPVRLSSARGEANDVQVVELQAALAAVVQRALAFDTRPHEDLSVEQMLDVPVRACVELLQAGIDVLSKTLERYEPSEPAEAPVSVDGEKSFLHGVDTLMATSEGVSRIADLAFIGRLELSMRREQLQALTPEGDPWAVLSMCAGTRRKVIKSITAVESALCEHEELPARTVGVFATEVQHSLEVRRAYTVFRRAFASGPAAGEDIRPHLRRAAVAIAVLTGRDVYQDLRVDDRMQLRALQQRVIAWLRGAESSSARTGLRLWQDLAAFAGMLVLVNNRTELREHDRQLSLNVVRALEHRAADAPLEPEDLERLKPLHGRDDELDEWLASPDPRPSGECRARLLQIAGTLSTTPPASSSDEASQETAPATDGSHPPGTSAAGEEAQAAEHGEAK